MPVDPKRSAMMSRVRGRDTSPELLLRHTLWARGLRYRIQRRVGRSRPDLVFLGPMLAVFVDGCFWHGCPIHYVRPRSRETFWARKLLENVRRDRRQTLELESQGWTVLRIWEHEILSDLEAAADLVSEVLHLGKAPNAPDWRVVEVEPVAEGVEVRRCESLRDPGVKADYTVTRGPQLPRV